MITMAEAEERVNKRHEPLMLRHMDREEMVRLSCAGTGVDGGELSKRILEDLEDMAKLWQQVGGGIVGGVLLRMFWLGYELGEADR